MACFPMCPERPSGGRLNVVVTVGQTDDGKDVSQWLNVACFGDTAKEIVAKARKGDRVDVYFDKGAPIAAKMPPKVGTDPGGKLGSNS